MIAHQMRTHLEDRQLLIECQHGFWKHHSCELQLIHTILHLHKHTNFNTQVGVLVLDLKKAFTLFLIPN